MSFAFVRALYPSRHITNGNTIQDNFYFDFMPVLLPVGDIFYFYLSLCTLGQWVMDGEINNRPIYTADGGSKWMAVKTVSGC